MSSQANTNPQTEPTMEEILASIRKIISEDQPSDGKSATKPSPVKAQSVVEPAPVRVAVPQPITELDVLDLTDEVEDEEPPAPVVARAVAPPPPAAASAPAPVIENDVIFQSIEPGSRAKEHSMDDFISDTTRSAMGRAFANINGPAPQVTLKGGSIEAIFNEAVQEAFRSALKEWVDDHSNDVMDQLRPLIRAWMDEHLPPLIEAAVIKEITRAAARKP
jgi:cell pole-organizing protein PopZ